MATFAEKLIAYVGADITEYVKKVGSELPRIARGAATAISKIGSVAQASFSLVGRAASLALKPLRAVASALQSIGSWVWRQGKRALFAVGAGLAAATREAVLFESAMAEVWSILDVGPERLAAMSDEVLKLAARFGEAPARMAKAAYQAISAGVPGGKVGGFLGTAAKAGVAGVSDTFTAVDVLTTVVNSYGMAIEDAAKVSDLLFTTVREGKTTFPELASSIGRVAAIASQAGVSFEEVSAAIGTLTKGGLSTDEAMTALRQSLVSIIKPGEEAMEAADALGIRFSAAGLRAQGLGAFLQEVAEKAKGDVEAMARLFPNVRALAGVMSLAGSQSKEFARQLQVMYHATGATDKAFEKIAGTVGFRLKAAWATIRASAVKIGDVFKAGTVGWVETLAEWSQKLATWFREHEADIKATLARVKTWLGEQWKALCDRMGWDTEDMWFEIQIMAIKAKNFIVRKWDDIKAGAKRVYDGIVKIWEGLEPALTPLWNAALAALQGDWDKALEELGTGFERLSEILTRALGVILQIVTPVAVKIGLTIGAAIAKGIWNAVKDSLADLGEQLAKSKWRYVLGPFPDIGDWLGGQFGPDIPVYGDPESGWDPTGGDWDPDSEWSPDDHNAPPGEDGWEWVDEDEVPKMAEGGIVRKPTLAMIGEKGPEAVVPLGKGGGAGGQVVVNQTFNYRTDRREAERLAELTRRLQRRGRLGYAY